MAGYHETFWVVVGTTAPVLALSLGILASRINRMTRPATDAYYQNKVFVDRKIIWQWGLFGYLPLIAMFFCGVGLYHALMSLAQEKDFVGPSWDVLSTLVAFLLLVLSSFAVPLGLEPAMENFLKQTGNGKNISGDDDGAEE